jgi:hypothetical protein
MRAPPSEGREVVQIYSAANTLRIFSANEFPSTLRNLILSALTAPSVPFRHMASLRFCQTHMVFAAPFIPPFLKHTLKYAGVNKGN